MIKLRNARQAYSLSQVHHNTFSGFFYICHILWSNFIRTHVCKMGIIYKTSTDFSVAATLTLWLNLDYYNLIENQGGLRKFKISSVTLLHDI